MRTSRQCTSATTGFSLIELMIAVTLTGILAAIAVNQFSEAAYAAKRAEVAPSVSALASLEVFAIASLDEVIEVDEAPRSLAADGSDRGQVAWPSDAGDDWARLGWQPDGALYDTYRVIATTDEEGKPSFCVVGASNVDGNAEIEMVYQLGTGTPSTTDACDGSGGSYSSGGSSSSSSSSGSGGDSSSSSSSDSSSSGTGSESSSSDSSSSSSSSSSDSSSSDSSSSSSDSSSSSSSSSSDSSSSSSSSSSSDSSSSSSSGSGSGGGSGGGSGAGRSESGSSPPGRGWGRGGRFGGGS